MDEKNAFNTDLDPEVIKIRDKIISKIGDKPLEEVNSIIKKLLNESMDEVTRLGALAARLKIIRSKIDLLYERKVEIKPEKQVKRTEEEKKEEKPKKSEEKWIRLKMLEAGEVNGKQIDKGVILDVKEEDGKKLVESKKAEVVEEVSEGASPIQKSEDTKKEQELKYDKKEGSETNEKINSPLKQNPKTEQDSSLNKETEQEDSEENSKAKNLLEKHEDSVQEDDKNQETDQKKSDKQGEVNNENIEPESKTDDQVNASSTNESDKQSVSDADKRQQKASKIDENKENTEEQDIKAKSQDEHKFEDKKDSSPEANNDDKDVEKEIK